MTTPSSTPLSLWPGPDADAQQPMRQSARSTRICILCTKKPKDGGVPMYRLTYCEASWDPGKIVFWLCTECFPNVELAIKKAQTIAKH